MANIYDTIQQAIDNKTELSLTVKHAFGESFPGTRFQAYILGDDAYQYKFVWGYLPDSNDYYRFSLDHITAAKATKDKYSVREDACYQYAIDEDHFARLQGFANIFNTAARLGNK